MHITGFCPFCRSPYQVQASLRGQPVRCPNAACKQVFPVPADGSPTSPPPRQNPVSVSSQRSGAVGDLVPILPAEEAPPPMESSGSSKHVSEMLPVAPVTPAAENPPKEGDWWQAAPPARDPSTQPPTRAPAAPSPSPPPSESPWWQNAPPPVRNAPQTAEQPAAAKPSQPRRPAARATSDTQAMRRPSPSTSETQEMAALLREQPTQPRELPPGAWEPPPVRRGAAGQEPDSPATKETAASETHQPRLSKRLAKMLIVGSIVTLVFAVVVGVGCALWMVQNSEAVLSKKAHDEYDSGAFPNAADQFTKLAKRFTDSDSNSEYKFMAEWSALSGVATDPEADPVAVVPRLDQFVKEHEKNPHMAEHAHDAGQRVMKLTKLYAARNQNPSNDEPLKVGEAIEQLRRRVLALDPAALTKEDLDKIEADLRQVRRAVELARKRREVLAQLQKQDRETWMEAIKRSTSFLATSERELPELKLGQDAEARTAIQRLYDGHLAGVVYKPRTDDPPPPPRSAEEDGEPLLFAPLLPSASAAPGRAPPNDPIVMALVRGILYALKKSNGELKWATRVGVDTTVLPKRVLASAFSPELLLVLSADTHTLTALGVEGHPLWEYHVGQPVLGRPIIIEHRAYLADYTGVIHEIELSRGQLLGRWHLGQPLTRGGAREGQTSRIYFPADDSCVYVLDVDPKNRRCLTILYDGHPAGSLRSEPIIIAPENENSPGYLILNEASGLDRMKLQVFELPLQDRHAPPYTLDPPALLAGWTWFEPRVDGEKLTILSDAGILGLFGIKQLGNSDQPLFPLLQPDGLDLSPFLPSKATLSRERGRSQVVHMQNNDFWVLARGQLQQMHLGMEFSAGPQAKPGWKEPLALGSPLHESQRLEDVNTRSSTFYLVTQELERQTCLATAVDELGKILWQRQLGLVCQGEPLSLTPAGGGPPMLLPLDQGGGLFTLDPSVPAGKLSSCWRSIAPALEENPLAPPRLLLAADGRSAYEVAVPGDGRELLVRHIEWSGDERALHITPHTASLLSSDGSSVMTPAGPPVVLGSYLLLPVIEGNAGLIKRMSLKPDKLQTGPDWRAKEAPASATCSLIALAKDRFLTTDGHRGMTVYEWKPDEEWQPLPKEKERDPLVKLDHLVAAPPVLVPNAFGPQPGVAVVDSAGLLYLFELQADGSLRLRHSSNLKGNLTAGPFVQQMEGGWRIGCVLDRSHLVWLDLTTKLLWDYSTGGPGILGKPQFIDDMLVIALQSGRYVGIDPKTGQAKGPGYQLRTSTAPAAAPMPFGRGQMFAPLTDGSALVLSLDRLREPGKKK